MTVGFEDLCLEMLLHTAPLSQFMYCTHSIGYFCSCRRVGKPESETDCHTNVMSAA